MEQMEYNDLLKFKRQFASAAINQAFRRKMCNE